MTAAPPAVPAVLFDQLVDGGVLVAPVGEGESQELLRFRKRNGAITRESLGPVRFVPMIRGE